MRRPELVSISAKQSSSWRLLQTYSILLLALVALQGLLISPAQAQGGCVVYFETDGVTIYLRFPSSNILTGSSGGYIDSGCTVSGLNAIESDPGPWRFGDGFVLASNSNIARGLCESLHGDRVVGVARATTYSSIYRCHARSVRGGSGSAGGGSFRDGVRVCSADINLPLTDLRLHAFDGMNSGIQFKRLNNCGIGDPAVIAMGFLDAVDVWSNVGSGYSVCFPQKERIVFLDAGTSPRTLMEIDYAIEGSWICAAMDRAGTMVLVEAADTTATQVESTRRPGTDDSIDDAIDLKSCSVTTLVNLRLRATPWGRIVDVMPADSEVSAVARTQSWFNVSFEEAEGWSAAWLTKPDGECNWPSEDSNGGE